MTAYKLSPSCQIPNLANMYQVLFKNKLDGVFVEVGGYDGESFSNTSGLADAGWQGLYIEPVPFFAEQCGNRHYNNNVMVAQRAIGPSAGRVTLHVGGTLTTLKEGHVQAYEEIDWAKGHHRGQKIQVKVDRLDSILKKACINPGFDLLVVDVEGSEPEVFESFDLDVWAPKVMIVELEDEHHSFQEYEDIIEPIKKLRKKILDSGYKEFFRDEINTMFVRDGVFQP